MASDIAARNFETRAKLIYRKSLIVALTLMLSVNKPLRGPVRSGTTGGSSVTSRESEPSNPARYPVDDPVTLSGTADRGIVVIISPGSLEVNNQCNTIGLLFHLLVHC